MKNFLLKAIRSAYVTLGDGFRWFPLLTVSLCLLRLIESVLPAAQVYAISSLVSYGAGENVPWSNLLFVTVVAGGLIPLESLASGLETRLQLQLRHRYQQEIVDIMASLDGTQRRDPSMADRVQAARDAIPFNIAWQATSAITVLQALITSLFLAITLGRIDVIAALLAFLSLVPAIVAFSIVSRTENRYWPLISSASRRSEYYEDQLRYQQSADELDALNALLAFAHRTKQQIVLVAHHWLKVSNARVITSVASGIICAILLFGALSSLVWGSSEVSGGELAGAVMGTVSGLLATRAAGSAFGEMASSVPMVDSYLDLRHDVLDTLVDKSAHHPSGSLSVGCENVVFSYDGHRHILDGVSFRASHGTMVAIVGANGAGKTTLASILTGGLEPTEGTVARISADRLASISQDFVHFELTVREFLTLGLDQNLPDDPTIRRALEDVGLSALVDALPQGTDTQLGTQWGGVDLSGGEWQRLALARLLMSPATIWMLDEPTSAIDAETEERIFAMLRRYAAERTIILISHRAWTLREADEIYVLRDGTICQQGSFDELVHQPGYFAELFKNQLIDTGHDS